MRKMALPAAGVLVALLAAGGAGFYFMNMPEENPPVVGRMLIVCVDGLTVEHLGKGKTPTIDALRARGAYVVLEGGDVTGLPAQISLMTGARPEKHGITWNDERQGTPAVETLLTLAAAKGKKVTMAGGDPRLNVLSAEKVETRLPKSPMLTGDMEVMATLARAISGNKPEVIVAFLPTVGRVVAAEGEANWRFPVALEQADTAVEMLSTALRDAGVEKETVVMVVGTPAKAGQRVPLVMTGPQVKQVTVDGNGLTHADALATAAYYLGLPRHRWVEGDVVRGATGE